MRQRIIHHTSCGPRPSSAGNAGRQTPSSSLWRPERCWEELRAASAVVFIRHPGRRGASGKPSPTRKIYSSHGGVCQHRKDIRNKPRFLSERVGHSRPYDAIAHTQEERRAVLRALKKIVTRRFVLSVGGGLGFVTRQCSSTLRYAST